MQKVVTCLGFNNNAEEAINFYTSIVKNSKILTISRNGDAVQALLKMKKLEIAKLKQAVRSRVLE